MKKKNRKTKTRPPAGFFNAYDLFGEIPVTWDEVYTWVELVAGIPRDSPRQRYYIKYWNVPEKIKLAKLHGTFHDIMK